MGNAVGEDTAFAPLLPVLFDVMKGQPPEHVRSPADVGALYMTNMQARVPEVHLFQVYSSQKFRVACLSI